MSDSLKIFAFAKVVSTLAFLMIGYASSQCSSNSQPVETSSQVEVSLKKDSITSYITDTEAVNLILRYNPELTYDEAEELLFRGMDEGVN